MRNRFRAVAKISCDRVPRQVLVVAYGYCAKESIKGVGKASTPRRILKQKAPRRVLENCRVLLRHVSRPALRIDWYMVSRNGCGFALNRVRRALAVRCWHRAVEDCRSRQR